mgnify:CR=1 FL=1
MEWKMKNESEGLVSQYNFYYCRYEEDLDELADRLVSQYNFYYCRFLIAGLSHLVG